MENKRSIDFVKNGAEFRLPNLINDKDVQTALDLLTIQKDAELEYKRFKPDGLPPEIKKDAAIPESWSFYYTMVATKSNLDKVVYLLKRIDSKVTREQVSRMGIKWIAEFINDCYPLMEGEEKTPQKKTSGQAKKK